MLVLLACFTTELEASLFAKQGNLNDNFEACYENLRASLVMRLSSYDVIPITTAKTGSKDLMI